MATRLSRLTVRLPALLHIMLRCVSVLNTHCQKSLRHAWSSRNLARNVRTSSVSRRRFRQLAGDRRTATKFDRSFQLKTGDFVAKPGTTEGLFTSRRWSGNTALPRSRVTPPGRRRTTSAREWPHHRDNATRAHVYSSPPSAASRSRPVLAGGAKRASARLSTE